MKQLSNPSLDKAVKALEADLVKTLQAWIGIPSLKAAPAGANAPFGAEIRRMLDLALADAKRLGFAPRDIDGYAADMEIGEGEETVAVLAHLDVVPAGEGWRTPPFESVIENGNMYGRGTSDNKGPAVAAMYAMKAVQDAGIPLKKKVRLVLGCDEESGWDDIAYYQKKIGLPRVGFSPDACYPLINTEKGICHLTLRGTLPEEGVSEFPVFSLRSGERANVIPSTAVAVLGGDIAALTERAADFAKRTGYPVTVEAMGDGQNRVTVGGVGGHASMPDLGQNAAAHLLQLLHALEAGGGSHAAIDLLAQAIGNDTDGSGFGIAGSDAVSGPLTINLGILDLQDRALSLTLDIRYPVMFNAEQLMRFIQLRVAPLELTVEAGHGQAPHHVPESSATVQTLLTVYGNLTEFPPATMAIGGGTYARALPEGVAFGAVFPDEEELAHQAGENVSIERMMLNVRIFAHAIAALAG